ncbi:hypothetical protein INT44_002594 [Umbelopsis vinacea]|uniref:UBA domain-containing protein n=1 Tax=Umbelopsis vinacea TaxID=44442 RepID=A0A8H7PF89_9FUNG|nr:hypothetical protein INT44_002594 [Umbelopsis vinacea]
MDVDEDAVQQLADLGIPRQQAFIALQKYNNDVMRAADYIFSGHAEQDLVEQPLELPEAAHPAAESADVTHPNDGSASALEPANENDKETDPIDGNPASISETPSLSNEPLDVFDEQVNLDKWPVAGAITSEEDNLLPMRKKSPIEPSDMEQIGPITSSSYDAQQWSLVPYQNDQKPFSADNGQETDDHYSYYNLTWWRDPLPIYRKRMMSVPVGLRPPPYDFSCSPPLIQSLYHVPLFRTAILCQKPTPSNWGNKENYWKGTGRGIPDEPKSTIDLQPPPYEVVAENAISTDVEKMSLNSITPDSESSYGSDSPEESSVMAKADENGFLAAKTAANLKGEFRYFPGSYNSLTNTFSVVHELQRLFAFLSYTNRRYVSVNNVVRAIQYSGNIDGTELTNARPEGERREHMKYIGVISPDKVEKSGLLDQLITCTGFDNTSEKLFELADGNTMNASSLFTISAIIEMFVDGEIQQETDQETAFFLVISPDETTFDFHGCLRPLIYEDNYDSDSDMDNGIVDDQKTDCDTRSKTCKITSFTNVPPILHIFLEDPNQYSIGVHTAAGGRHNRYKVEKNIYMDRYLHANRDKVLHINQEIRNAKAKVTRTKEKLNYYNRNCRSHTAIEYLEHTLCYFNSKDADDETIAVEKLINHSHVMEDCDSFEEELLIMHNVEVTFNDEIHASDDEEDDDDDTASVALESSPDMVETSGDTQKAEWVEECLMRIQQEESRVPGDNYRVIESLEIFLAKFGEISALRYLLENFGSAFNNLAPEEAGQVLTSMKTDPMLEWQYHLYQDYVTIAEIICQAVEMITQHQDETALKYLVIAKEQTVKWKEYLWRRSHANNIEALFDGPSFLLTIQKLGKHVLSVLYRIYSTRPLLICPVSQLSNAKAYAKASNEAYRKRGFEDAIRISKYAQALLDPESLEHDPFYNHLQEQWLSFTDTITGSLDEQQAELFNTLVMSFLEYQGMDDRDLEITSQEQDSTEDKNLRQPTWERYRDAMEKVNQILLQEA